MKRARIFFNLTAYSSRNSRVILSVFYCTCFLVFESDEKKNLSIDV